MNAYMKKIGTRPILATHHQASSKLHHQPKAPLPHLSLSLSPTPHLASGARRSSRATRPWLLSLSNRTRRACPSPGGFHAELPPPPPRVMHSRSTAADAQGSVSLGGRRAASNRRRARAVRRDANARHRSWERGSDQRAREGVTGQRGRG